MGITDFISRWRPGLPSLGQLPPSIWVVDPDPEGKDPNEHALAFLVTPDRDEAHLFANRTGEHVEIDEGALVKKTKKMYMKPGNRRIPVWSCRLLTAGEIEDTNPRWKRHVHRLPDDVTGVPLEPCKIEDADIDYLAEQF